MSEQSRVVAIVPDLWSLVERVVEEEGGGEWSGGKLVWKTIKKIRCT